MKLSDADVLPLVRRFGGAALLVLTMVAATALGQEGRHAVSTSFAIPFSRGETPEDGAQADAIEAASYLKAYPRLDARILGYVAPGSDPAAGAALSERRAQIVRNLIAAEGIDDARLHAVGAGSDKGLHQSPDESDSVWLHRNARVIVDLIER